MPVEKEPRNFRQRVGEIVVDSFLPVRTFKGPITREIETCFDYFGKTYSSPQFDNSPRLIKGIGITIGKMVREGKRGRLKDLLKNESRGYFWEIDGVRHVVGQEIMTRNQEKALIEAIHAVTIPYNQSEYWKNEQKPRG